MLDGLTADRLDAAMQGGWRAFADRGERIRSTPARPLTGLPLRFEGPRPKANRPKAGLARGGEARLRRHETPSYRSQIELNSERCFYSTPRLRNKGGTSIFTGTAISVFARGADVW